MCGMPLYVFCWKQHEVSYYHAHWGKAFQMRNVVIVVRNIYWNHSLEDSQVLPLWREAIFKSKLQFLWKTFYQNNCLEQTHAPSQWREALKMQTLCLHNVFWKQFETNDKILRPVWLEYIRRKWSEGPQRVPPWGKALQIFKKNQFELAHAATFWGASDLIALIVA